MLLQIVRTITEFSDFAIDKHIRQSSTTSNYSEYLIECIKSKIIQNIHKRYGKEFYCRDSVSMIGNKQYIELVIINGDRVLYGNYSDIDFLNNSFLSALEVFPQHYLVFDFINSKYPSWWLNSISQLLQIEFGKQIIIEKNGIYYECEDKEFFKAEIDKLKEELTKSISDYYKYCVFRIEDITLANNNKLIAVYPHIHELRYYFTPIWDYPLLYQDDRFSFIVQRINKDNRILINTSVKNPQSIKNLFNSVEIITSKSQDNYIYLEDEKIDVALQVCDFIINNKLNE